MRAASRTSGDAATPDVITRPPLLYLGGLVLGIVLDHLLPLRLTWLEAAQTRWTLAGVLILAGGAIMAAGIRDFARAATPVPSNQPVRALVTTGIHGWSRNPIYIGMFLLYAGIAVAAHSTWALVLVLPIAVVVRYGVVAREEAYLEQRFGDSYRDYKARVRRWL